MQMVSNKAWPEDRGGEEQTFLNQHVTMKTSPALRFDAAIVGLLQVGIEELGPGGWVGRYENRLFPVVRNMIL